MGRISPDFSCSSPHGLQQIAERGSEVKAHLDDQRILPDQPRVMRAPTRCPIPGEQQLAADHVDRADDLPRAARDRPSIPGCPPIRPAMLTAREPSDAPSFGEPSIDRGVRCHFSNAPTSLHEIRGLIDHRPAGSRYRSAFAAGGLRLGAAWARAVNQMGMTDVCPGRWGSNRPRGPAFPS